MFVVNNIHIEKNYCSYRDLFVNSSLCLKCICSIFLSNFSLITEIVKGLSFDISVNAFAEVSVSSMEYISTSKHFVLIFLQPQFFILKYSFIRFIR